MLLSDWSACVMFTLMILKSWVAINEIMLIIIKVYTTIVWEGFFCTNRCRCFQYRSLLSAQLMLCVSRYTWRGEGHPYDNQSPKCASNTFIAMCRRHLSAGNAVFGRIHSFVCFFSPGFTMPYMSIINHSQPTFCSIYLTMLIENIPVCFHGCAFPPWQIYIMHAHIFGPSTSLTVLYLPWHLIQEVAEAIPVLMSWTFCGLGI